jgi:hypothetical protein
MNFIGRRRRPCASTALQTLMGVCFMPVSGIILKNRKKNLPLCIYF